MVDLLNETAIDRGVAEAKRWRGMLRWQAGAIVVGVAGLGIALWQGVSGFWASAIGAGATLALLVGQIVVGIILAPYLQRDEARDALRDKLGTDTRRAELADLFSLGSRIGMERITLAEYDDWRVRLGTWTDGAADFLLKRYGPAEREMFVNPPSPMAADVLGSVNAQHNNGRLSLGARLGVISRILERGT